MARRTLIAANWKMNGDKSLCVSMQNAIASANNVGSDVEVLICPPFTLLNCLTPSNKLFVGAQNSSQFKQGAYTGEISVSMLKDAGCEYVIVGHSERREIFGETNQIIADKFVNIASSGLKPILCVGESLSERESGLTKNVLQAQLEAVISHSEANHWENAVIAYEPIWAIGTGKTATPGMAQQTHQFLRELLSKNSITEKSANTLRILYGGSMKPDNAVDLLSEKDIDGGLVGGASLNPKDFITILSAA